VNDHVLETLMAFDAESAEFEDGGDDESDADDEEDGPPGRARAGAAESSGAKAGPRQFTTSLRWGSAIGDHNGGRGAPNSDHE
jgi:hypothetical protein